MCYQIDLSAMASLGVVRGVDEKLRGREYYMCWTMQVTLCCSTCNVIVLPASSPQLYCLGLHSVIGN